MIEARYTWRDGNDWKLEKNRNRRIGIGWGAGLSQGFSSLWSFWPAAVSQVRIR
jgi:hypothetical protein